MSERNPEDYYFLGLDNPALKDEHGKPIKLVKYFKENGKYIAQNLQNPQKKKEYDTKEQLLKATVYSRATIIDDQTGENLAL